MAVCATPGCPTVVKRGHCLEHARQRDRRRGSAASRGYDGFWARFIPRFIGMLVAAGVAPVCGATLPGGPKTTDSRCQAQGFLTFQSEDGTALHLDHEPALAEFERNNPAAVCDPQRIQLLCRQCHSAKTMTEART